MLKKTQGTLTSQLVSTVFSSPHVRGFWNQLQISMEQSLCGIAGSVPRECLTY